MGAGMPRGRYEMQVAVHDSVRNEDAVSSITVQVYNIEKAAFDNQVLSIPAWKSL